MSCRKATTASTYGMGLSAMFAKSGRGRRHDAPVWRNSNFVGGHSICPRCMEFYLNNAAGTSLRPTVGKVQIPSSGRGDPSPTEVRFYRVRPPESPLPEGAFFVRTSRVDSAVSGGALAHLSARRRRAKRGLFEKSPLLTPLKTF